MFQPGSQRDSVQDSGPFTQRSMPVSNNGGAIARASITPQQDEMEMLRNNQMMPNEPEMFQYMETYREVGSDQGDPGIVNPALVSPLNDDMVAQEDVAGSEGLLTSQRSYDAKELEAY